MCVCENFVNTRTRDKCVCKGVRAVCVRACVCVCCCRIGIFDVEKLKTETIRYAATAAKNGRAQIVESFVLVMRRALPQPTGPATQARKRARARGRARAAANRYKIVSSLCFRRAIVRTTRDTSASRVRCVCVTARVGLCVRVRVLRVLFGLLAEVVA